MTDYKQLYETKNAEYEELFEQYSQLEEQTNLIINDLEEQLRETKRKHDSVQRELSEQREKSKCFKSSIEREVDLAQKQRNQFKRKFVQFEKKVIQLQIMNESLESDLRSTKARLSEYEAQAERTMEQLALAQIQLEETHQSNKQTVARLKGQLKETEEQLFALHQVKQPQQIIPRDAPEQSEVSPIQMPGHRQAFRQTLRGIRDYLEQLESRKADSRKMILKMCSQ